MPRTDLTRFSEQPSGSAGRGQTGVRVDATWNAFATWMRDDKNYSAKTRLCYLNQAKAAHTSLRLQGHKGLAWATADQLRAYWDSKPPTAATRRHVRSALSAFFRCLNDLGWRPDNPADKLPQTRPPRRYPRPLAPDDVKRLLAVTQACDPILQAVMYLFLFCGFRVSELQALQWADLEGDWIRVVGKGDKERMVPVPPEAMTRLMLWRKETTSARWMFPSPRWEDRQISVSTLEGWVTVLGEIAGLTTVLTPHILRHTYATQVLGKTKNLRAVQELMGHSRPETTALYTKVAPMELAEIAKALDY